jgi:hypothetical protein
VVLERKDGEDPGADHVKNEEVLHSKEERNILRKLKKSHLE